ncbi:uncharacterized protein LOC121872949 [Homarus americanus]|uniref:uncharacterized protein LOC121872949 n=1 Tax=Homarus americanus TaxID=6706 RepID=UPI001C45FE94|nr:uncharacterized protein LOC121872949 [Homarus americanus]XP_042232023.1 uncharacterized protein LOC121872949 [Homarus americanus]XP_042232024.1 uncharacterized protein LOC121872949 [Homarus americanus]
MSYKEPLQLSDLPWDDVIFRHIFPLLKVADLCHLQGVSKDFQQLYIDYMCSCEKLDFSECTMTNSSLQKVVMQSQNRDPRGLLNCLPNLTKTPDVLITLLEATQRFDLSIIKHSSLIDNDQRKIYLKVGQSPLPLKHLVRVFLRQELAEKLPTRIDELELPVIMKKYLLYEIS